MRMRLLPILLLAAPAVAAAQTYPQGDGYGDQGYYEDDQAYPDEYDDAAPDEDYVWEDGYSLDNGTVVEGFYRERQRPGFRWVSAGYSNGVWVDARWEPVRVPAGYVVERGGRGHDGYWIADYLRPAHRNGYRWVNGRWNNGRWYHGYWQPIQARHDHVWVQGYWTADGQWIDGYWRPRHRNSFTWVDGYWAYGRWHAGYWKPAQVRAGFVWTPGYHGRKGYVEGSWRQHNRSGYHWIDGHWRGGKWIPGYWERGNKRVVKRRHRVRPVHFQTRVRAGHHRAWRNGVLQPVRVDNRRQPERVDRRDNRRQPDRVDRRDNRRQPDRVDRRDNRRQPDRVDRRDNRNQPRPRVHDRRNQ